jgi:hypothetical protein
MSRAVNRLRDSLHYRRESFSTGLRAAGFDVVPEIDKPQPDDLLLLWNRGGGYHEQATKFEAAGARVIVTENGYLSKTWCGKEWFALGLGHHGGAGVWPDGGPDRWDSWNVTLAPWRTDGTEVVILGQRSIGEPNLASPVGWAEKIAKRFPGSRIRPHPGKAGGADLLDDLKNARAVVTWGSGAGLVALAAGIPAWYECPSWIGAAAAVPIGAELRRDDDERLGMFRRLAHAMYSLDEIRSGEAFRCLLT